MRVDRTARASWWTNPIFREQEQEIEQLRSENARLRALLKPPTYGFPAKWRLTPQQRVFLSALYAEGGCVSYDRLSRALGGETDGPSRLHLGVIVANIRRKTAQYGVEIEAYYGQGYGLSVEGRSFVRIAVEAVAAMRVA